MSGACAFMPSSIAATIWSLAPIARAPAPKMPVRISPGQIALTRILARPSCAALTVVRWMTPALATE